jgi:HSP20 family protein
MTRGQKQKDELLLDEELAAAFLNDDDQAPLDDTTAAADNAAPVQADWQEDDENDALVGQLALDVYETKDRLVVKARTAGVDKKDLDVSISDGVLTINGTLSAGDDEAAAENYHMQECYWGEFSRTINLPVAVKEDGIEASLKDGVLTITFEKIKQETAKKIEIL